MKKIFLLCLMVALAGCGDKTERLVREQLKDPESAEFKDVKGNCGLVNAKNSHGGYTGFKRFVVGKNTLFIESNNNRNSFNYRWVGSCTGLDVKESLDMDTCIAVGGLAESMIKLRLSGWSIDYAESIARGGDKQAIEPSLKVIKEAYKYSVSREGVNNVAGAFGMSMFMKCALSEMDFKQS